MAIFVKINKIEEKNGIAYYKVSMQDSHDFYMGIDKNKRMLKFYSTQDFTNPIKIINCQDQNEIIGTLPGIHTIAYTRALAQAIKALDMEEFPNFLDYAA